MSYVYCLTRSGFLSTIDVYDMIGSQITTAAEIKKTKSHYDRRAVQTHRQLYDTPGTVFV